MTGPGSGSGRATDRDADREAVAEGTFDASRARAWLFDLDGTLVDSAPDLHGALVATFAHFGHDAVISDADLRAWVGHGARAMIERGLAARAERLDAHALDARFRYFLDHYTAHIADASRPFPGVVETLDALRERALPLACVTNKLEGLSRDLLDALGLTTYFGAVVGGDTADAPKPDAAPLRHACARLDVPLDAALMVGDSSTDVAAARNAGVPVIAVSYGYRGSTSAEDLGADLLVDDLRDALPQR